LIEFTDAKVFKRTNRHLKDVEVIVLKGVFEGKTYNEIAQTSHYSAQYLQQDASPRLFQLLSRIFETNRYALIKTILQQYSNSAITEISEDERI
jgi:hypothetical protein